VGDINALSSSNIVSGCHNSRRCKTLTLTRRNITSHVHCPSLSHFSKSWLFPEPTKPPARRVMRLFPPKLNDMGCECDGLPTCSFDFWNTWSYNSASHMRSYLAEENFAPYLSNVWEGMLCPETSLQFTPFVGRVSRSSSLIQLNLISTWLDTQNTTFYQSHKKNLTCCELLSCIYFTLHDFLHTCSSISSYCLYIVYTVSLNGRPYLPLRPVYPHVWTG
jgi:hypothetical protein